MRGTGAGRYWIRPLRGTGSPSDRALHRLVGWYAVGFRLWIAVAVVVAAPLAATAAVSGAWLAAALVTLSAWSVFFAVRVGRRGVTGPLVLADAAVIVALIVVHHLVVPAALISAGTTWMLPLASTAIYISQLCIPPPAGLPVAAVVIAAYVTTVAHPAGALYLVFQALATAALMVLVRRGGRNADAAIGRQLQLEQDLKVEAARRADQREQDRRLHDTILSTLTMVASGALDMSSPVLAAQASRDLQVLHSWPTLPEPGPPGAVALPDRLAAVAAEAAPLRVATSFFSATKTVPATAVDRIADCAAEALRNVARHAGTGTAELRVSDGNGQVVVEIIDQGRGFDAWSVPRSRRGISESIHGRMAAIGGTAEISAIPGAGTTVTLRWPREGTAETQRSPAEGIAETQRSPAEGTAGEQLWPGEGTAGTQQWPSPGTAAAPGPG
ncbi:MAG TPA: ATP-binding protein [Streptosporangiaceae bacterium]|nr:ATP-binding protein [Streptosporangiaceae bacterium]